MTLTKNRSCAGKIAYTRADANKHAYERRRRFERVHAYKCKFCSWFHVGHNNTGKGRRR